MDYPQPAELLRKLCDDEKPRWLALEHLETERLKNLFVRLLKWLVTRDEEYWTYSPYLGITLRFAHTVMNLAKDRQDLFCATMECLEVIEIPLYF